MDARGERREREHTDVTVDIPFNNSIARPYDVVHGAGGILER